MKEFLPILNKYLTPKLFIAVFLLVFGIFLMVVFTIENLDGHSIKMFSNYRQYGFLMGVILIIIALVLIFIPEKILSKKINYFNFKHETEFQYPLYFKNLEYDKNYNHSSKLYVEDLINRFYKYPQEYINQEYLIDGIDKRSGQEINTKVIKIDSARISSFICFTDKENVVLFNRMEREEKTTIKNPKFDCFGSVGFENASLKLKITNENFFKSEILKLISIPGIAIEKNPSKNQNSEEIVVMFGFICFLSKEDLSKANGKGIEIIQIKRALDIESSTAKVKLALKYLNEISS